MVSTLMTTLPSMTMLSPTLRVIILMALSIGRIRPLVSLILTDRARHYPPTEIPYKCPISEYRTCATNHEGGKGRGTGILLRCDIAQTCWRYGAFSLNSSRDIGLGTGRRAK
jgi:hypothetical protein